MYFSYLLILMKILFSPLSSGKYLFWLVPLDMLIVLLDPFLPLGYEKMSGLIFAPIRSLQLVIHSSEMTFCVSHSYREDRVCLSRGVQRLLWKCRGCCFRQALRQTQKQHVPLVGKDWEHNADGSRTWVLVLLSRRKVDVWIAHALISSECNLVSVWILFYCVESPRTKEINSHSLINTY